MIKNSSNSNRLAKIALITASVLILTACGSKGNKTQNGDKELETNIEKREIAYTEKNDDSQMIEDMLNYTEHSTSESYVAVLDKYKEQGLLGSPLYEDMITEHSRYLALVDYGVSDELIPDENGNVDGFYIDRDKPKEPLENVENWASEDMETKLQNGVIGNWFYPGLTGIEKAELVEAYKNGTLVIDEETGEYSIDTTQVAPPAPEQPTETPDETGEQERSLRYIRKTIYDGIKVYIMSTKAESTLNYIIMYENDVAIGKIDSLGDN